MPTAYAVRLKADQSNPHDFVGIFIANSMDMLAEMVDECCNVEACECARLPQGGIYMSGKAVPIPYGEPPEFEDVNFFPASAFTDSWFPIFLRGQEVAWEPLDR